MKDTVANTLFCMHPSSTLIMIYKKFSACIAIFGGNVMMMLTMMMIIKKVKFPL